MTGLPDRRALEEFANRERESGGALVLCDIDNLKAVNRCLGNDAGDKVIRAFAALLAGAGTSARVGGAEFAVWMSDVSLFDAMRHAETLRRQFAGQRLLDRVSDLSITGSFGVAAFTRHTAFDMAFARADEALYGAKRLGGDRVVAYGDSSRQEVSGITGHHAGHRIAA